jgi:hypothetical protein
LVTTLDGAGHTSMFEAPDRISQLIVDFVEHYAGPKRTTGYGQPRALLTL